MSRSTKKGPFIHESLKKKIDQMNSRNEKKVVKTWSRASMIAPTFVGHTVGVHDGRRHVPVFITENMVGHRLGEFAPTRTFKAHGRGAAAETVAGVAAAPGAPGAPAAAAPASGAAPAAGAAPARPAGGAPPRGGAPAWGG